MQVGFGWPGRGSFDTDFAVTPPHPSSMDLAKLEAVTPRIPEANTIGFENVLPKKNVSNITLFINFYLAATLLQPFARVFCSQPDQILLNLDGQWHPEKFHNQYDKACSALFWLLARNYQ